MYSIKCNSLLAHLYTDDVIKGHGTLSVMNRRTVLAKNLLNCLGFKVLAFIMHKIVTNHPVTISLYIYRSFCADFCANNRRKMVQFQKAYLLPLLNTTRWVLAFWHMFVIVRTFAEFQTRKSMLSASTSSNLNDVASITADRVCRRVVILFVA